MKVNELKSRLILKSRDGLASYSKISASSNSIIDLYDVSLYFCKNIIKELLLSSKNEALLQPKKSDDVWLYDFTHKDELINLYNKELTIFKNSKKSLNVEETFDKWLSGKQENALRRINQIAHACNEVLKENGSYCQKIGYPYLTGKYVNPNGETDVYRAPIFLFGVDIIKIKSSKVIRFKLNDGFELNSALFEKYIFNNKEMEKVKIYDVINKLHEKWQDETIDYTFEDFLKSSIAEIKTLVFDRLGVKVDWSEMDSITNLDEIEKMLYQDSTKKELIQKINDEIVMSSWCTFGMFRLNNQAIIDDLTEWGEEGDEFLASLESSFVDPDRVVTHLNENEIVNISPLDGTQKKAIANALLHNTIIDGPPGTGKSQTIANLIINIIYRKKSALFCAEKRVATDVVYKRLGNFQKYSLFIHDLKNEKKSFYEQLKNNYQYVDKTYKSYVDFSEKLKNVDNRINDYKKNIAKLDFLKNNVEGINYYNGVCKYGNSQQWNSNFKNDWAKIGVIFKLTDKDNVDAAVAKVERYKEWYQQLQEYNLVKAILPFLSRYKNFAWKKIKNIELTVRYFAKKKLILAKVGVFKRIGLKKIDIEQYGNLEKQISFIEENIDELIQYYSFTDDLTQNLKEVFYNQPIENFVDIIRKYYISNFERMNNDALFMDDKNWSSDMKSLLEEKRQIIVQMGSQKIAYNIYCELKEYVQNNIERRRNFNNFSTRLTSGKRFGSVKEFFDKYNDLISIFCPIVICSLDACAAIFPLKKSVVDYAIYDEASQIFVERGITSLYRGKVAVVAGDDKQLQPTNFFLKDIDSNADEEFNEDENDSIKASEVASLLTYVQNIFDKHRLCYHYRSEYIELIDFSNKMFYDNELIACNVQKRTASLKPIITRDVDGVWTEQMNLAEAREVIHLINECIANRKQKESIGIITFNKKQASLIIDLIQEEIKNDNQVLGSEMNRIEDGEDKSLFIKNIEDVQGDERDVIIFSSAFAPDKNGRFIGNFGPVNKFGGECRINVAVSRAKKKIVLVKSIDSARILRPDRQLTSGATAFGKYLRYCELLQKQKINSPEIKSLLMNGAGLNNAVLDDFDSIFEKEVYAFIDAKLNHNLYELHNQVPAATYRIDMAIFNKTTQSYDLAIECDGWNYHSSPAQVCHDLDRQLNLEAKGWKFFRISSLRWMTHDRDKIYDELVKRWKGVANK